MIAAMTVILGLIGLGLAIPGAWLASLGGSLYYLIAGFGFLVAAGLVHTRRALAVWVYAAVILGSLFWALAEVGLDWWALAPRGWVIVLAGLPFLLPGLRRRLLRRDGRAASALPVAAASLAAGGVAVWAAFTDPHDIAGALPGPRAEAAVTGEDMPDGDWWRYGRTHYGQRWSPLDRITPANIAALEPAWTYRTGDVMGPDDVTETTYQVTPIKIGDRLFLCTAHHIAIALDAATGQEIWRFDPEAGLHPDRQHQTCRGVTYWRSPTAAEGEPCAERLFLPVADARLIALDARDGAVCTGFGDGGAVHLEEGMPHTPEGYYYATSPPVAVADRLIIGGAVNDNYSVESQSGVIRAYDPETGALLWNWDAGNPDRTEPIDIAGGETYTANSPNSWSIFSVDPALGLVYIPLGNQQPDQLGMGRSPAAERFATSVVALSVETGRAAWVFQTIHHDLWDMDVPAQPALLDLTMPDGSTRPALVAPTKQGDVYVLDRRNGSPILPVTRLPAPGGAIPEDFTVPEQPVSALSFQPPDLTEADMWGLTPFDQLACRIRFHRLTYEGRYTPPSLNGTLLHPGNFGIFNWGSVAVDPERQVMFSMPVYIPFTIRLVRAEDLPPPEDEAANENLSRNEGAPYGVYMGPFLGPLGVPCTAPPWGYVAGADLATGEIVWRRRNGTVRDMTPLPLPFETGVPGIGGPLMTRGGVAFLGATVDDYLRGYDVTTGEELWRARLPAGGQSTPMTYEQDGRQYVLIVAGGHGSVGTRPGDYVLAWTLPGG